MDKKQITINKLIAFRQTEKFSSSIWESRGLNPSSAEMCISLEKKFNDCADDLLSMVESGGNGKQLNKTLKNGLKRFNSSDYDTEEKEFISDYFFQLSTIVEVDIKENINRWLYGTILNSFFKATRSFQAKESINETLSQDCIKCGKILETFIISRKEGIPDPSWFIIQCNNCNEYNLLSTGPNIKELRFGNYKLAEQLSKSEYDESEAKIRLNQIRSFRK